MRWWANFDTTNCHFAIEPEYRWQLASDGNIIRIWSAHERIRNYRAKWLKHLRFVQHLGESLRPSCRSFGDAQWQFTYHDLQ
jgi:hypothetical protein